MSRTVDPHHHVIPDFYWETANEGGIVAGGINISITGLHRFEATAELDDGERRGVLSWSAARLIPRLAGVASAC